ncbi:MAG: Fe-S cluster assembly protein SufD [Parcubacteria group bacterium Gr01-1014_13]|nr:MAG: Fe-S cluster assembly protein SufD [Parcubacteria group bacterium Gr01-1014_13]
MPNKILFIDTIPDKTITLKSDEEIVIVGLITTGWPGVRHLTINAQGRGASCMCIFFILGTDNSSFDAKIQAIHAAPKTQIKARIRSALTDKSTCSIEGAWSIEKEGHGADTYFAHHTLLLSANASAKTAPFLEIKTDDVKAGHAASVGKVDADALFYLLSRGLSEQQARALLVQGFFETELGAIDDEEIKNKIREAVTTFLSQTKS